MKTTTYTRKVGLNRGKPRLWLEGKVLSDNGFSCGSPWLLQQVGTGLVLHVTPEGNRKVAGTAQRPIIDINSKVLLAGWSGEVLIEVMERGMLRVTRVEV